MGDDLLAEIKTRRSLVGDDPQAHGVQVGPGVLVDLDWLIGEVERLRVLLSDLEWSGQAVHMYETSCCPACYADRSQREPHAAGCWLAKELGR